jgi:hypothetical protein
MATDCERNAVAVANASVRLDAATAVGSRRDDRLVANLRGLPSQHRATVPATPALLMTWRRPLARLCQVTPSAPKNQVHYTREVSQITGDVRILGLGNIGCGCNSRRNMQTTAASVCNSVQSLSAPSATGVSLRTHSRIPSRQMCARRPHLGQLYTISAEDMDERKRTMPLPPRPTPAWYYQRHP